MNRKNKNLTTTYSSEYKSFWNARDRCNNPLNACYPSYGGRGILFLFQNFDEFFADIGPKQSENLSLDRRDNNGNYECGNIKWSTSKEQGRNKRRFGRIPTNDVAFVEHFLRTNSDKKAKDLAKDLHVCQARIRQLLKQFNIKLNWQRKTAK